MIKKAIDIFEREGVNALPFNPGMIARRNHIKLCTYDRMCDYYRTTPKLLETQYSNDGFTIYDEGIYIIAYNDRVQSTARQRWTLTHELCHIWLGHIKPGIESCRMDKKYKDQNDREADQLAAQLLCPLPVLHLCGVTSQKELVNLCGISFESANIRFEELYSYRSAQPAPMRSPDELRMLAQFAGFISDVVGRKAMRQVNAARYRRVDIAR